ncbi:uncharacterized protein FIBRA_00453 [Fibroporia radiculosa]|uniref:Uncharacterized protein n=1 Tax=Fibroporia radiculosa TaxID=599839 RepID=J4GHT2_9APHY|nr:uncharacterized protein FIBRA_00453 [Fibroporia radiculosa]CCL98455.1 predicted protein [Fibroporia radiculosa]
MKLSPSLLSLTTLAVGGYVLAAPSVDLQKRTACENRAIISTSNINVDDKVVTWETFGCGSSISARSEFKRQANATNVCDGLCTDTCNNLSGDLPPAADDCATIVDAITILNGSIAPTFVVDSQSIQQLSYGTCRYFFENLSDGPLEYCWLALGDMASAAGSACFPPTQPVYSEGICETSTGTWLVGAAHS